MDQRQINIVSTQLFQTFLQAWDQLVFAEILNPDFSGDEKFVARYAALFDGGLRQLRYHKSAPYQ